MKSDTNDKKTVLNALEGILAPNLEDDGPIMVNIELDDVDEEIKGFYYFLSFRKAASKAELDSLSRHDERKNSSLGAFSRQNRRKLKKYLPSTNALPKAISEAKNIYEMTSRVIDAIENDNSLDNDDIYLQLVFLNVLFEKYDGIITKLGIESNDVVSYFVKQSKSQDKKCNFLNCFDAEGNVLPDMAYYLRSIIHIRYKDIYQSSAIFKNVQVEDCSNYLISKEVFKQADEITKIKSEQKQIEEERIKEEKRLAKEKEEQERKNMKKQTEIVVKKTYNEMDELYKKIIMPGKYTLRKGIEDIVSKEELEVILNKLTRIPPNDKQKFIDEYLNRIYTKRLNYLMKISSKSSLKKIRTILNNHNEHKEINDAFNNVLMSDEFEEYTDEQLIEIIDSILNNKYLKETNNLQNYIIFANDNLVYEEFNRVFNSKSTDNKKSIIKSIKNHLLSLQNHDLNEIRSNKADAFHELMINNHKYVLGDNLKGYRYGARKTKVGVFALSVCQENQDKLQEIYNTNINASVILVYGLGSVITEKESDLMIRIKKYGTDNERRILHINDLFANPFTEETLKEAKKLINDGILTIQNMDGIDDPVDVKKCLLIKKDE